jgi:hypothetical protein
MGDEGVAILTERRIQSLGQHDSARIGIMRVFTALVDGQVRQIAEMVGMTAGTWTDMGFRIHVRIDVAVVIPEVLESPSELPLDVVFRGTRGRWNTPLFR